MRFQIKGMAADGALQRVFLDAATAADATQQAQQRGIRVVSLSNASPWFSRNAAARAKFPLLQFNQELLALLNAGISLLEAIQTLLEKEPRPESRKVLSDLAGALQEGLPLSAAFDRVPEVFPRLYVATVKASERIGGLPESLTRYISYQSQAETVRKKLIAAAIYPVLLIAVGLLVLGFLLIYVVPRFSGIYADMGDNLPLMTRLLLGWGHLMQQNAATAAGLAAAAAALSMWCATRPRTQQVLGHLVWRIPSVGRHIRTFQLARFYRTLGMLLRGGMPIVPSLNIVSGLLHPSMRAQLDAATQSVRDGRAISAAMEAHGLVTPVALRMLRVGERSGRMGEMMERIAEFHDEEMARWIDWFSRLLEPVLMAVIGVVIGTVVLLMYMPIFDLAGNLK